MARVRASRASHPIVRRAILGSRSATSMLARGAAYLTLLFGAVLFVLPFLWTLSTALKSSRELSGARSHLLPQDGLHWDNFVAVFTNPGINFPRYLLNTLIIVVFVIAGKVISCTLVGYGFARFKPPGSRLLFILMLSTMLLPGFVTLVPTFILFTTVFGWGNSFLPLIAPSFFGEAFSIFLLRQFFMGLPRDLDEAAIIDGAGQFRIFWQIMVPLVRPAIVSVAVLTFMGTWNDYFTPLIYLNDPDKYTLALGLQFLRDNTIGAANTGAVSNQNVLMAGALVMVVPMLAIFFVAQKQLVEGVNLTGLDGR